MLRSISSLQTDSEVERNTSKYGNALFPAVLLANPRKNIRFGLDVLQ